MDAHWNWMTGVVSSAKNAGLWIIVAFHKPCLSPDLATGCEGNGDYNGHNPNYQLETYLISHGVDVLLNAHAHIYARSKQLMCLGPTEPPSDSTVAVTYSQTCVANDGSSGVYTRGSGTVEVIQGVFSQRDGQLNFTRPDLNYFAEAMSARGSLTITPADCCWVNGSPADMASGNGIGMITVNATQISSSFQTSIFSHNPTNLSKFADSFVVRTPSKNSTSPPSGPSLLPLESSVGAAILSVAVVSVLLFRRRKRGNHGQPLPTSQKKIVNVKQKRLSINFRKGSLRELLLGYSDPFSERCEIFNRFFSS